MFRFSMKTKFIHYKHNTNSPTVDDLFAPCKGSKTLLDSRFHAVDSGFQLLDSRSFQWNFDSGFGLLVGFRIPTPVFRIPRPRIPDSTSKNFQDSGFQIQKFPRFRNPDSFTWDEPLYVRELTILKGV